MTRTASGVWQSCARIMHAAWSCGTQRGLSKPFALSCRTKHKGDCLVRRRNRDEFIVRKSNRLMLPACHTYWSRSWTMSRPRCCSGSYVSLAVESRSRICHVWAGSSQVLCVCVYGSVWPGFLWVRKLCVRYSAGLPKKTDSMRFLTWHTYLWLVRFLWALPRPRWEVLCPRHACLIPSPEEGIEIARRDSTFFDLASGRRSRHRVAPDSVCTLGAVHVFIATGCLQNSQGNCKFPCVSLRSSYVQHGEVRRLQFHFDSIIHI